MTAQEIVKRLSPTLLLALLMLGCGETEPEPQLWRLGSPILEDMSDGWTKGPDAGTWCKYGEPDESGKCPPPTHTVCDVLRRTCRQPGVFCTGIDKSCPPNSTEEP